MTTKKILGLDLGTTSIGWAKVIEGDNPLNSSIDKIGVRVNPLSTDEQTNFEKGKTITINAERTLKRGMRRNLDRYQLRRDNLVEVLIEHGIIDKETPLTEIGKNTTHQNWQLRSIAAVERIEKTELARVLLAINKKRGYKSSRKAKNEDEGQIIDGMAVAKQLYEEGITPGQLAYRLLKEGKKYLPDFYRSDLQAEFDKVWDFQKQHYPEILTDNFRKEISGKGQRATSSAFWNTFKFNTAENKGSREEKKLKAYKWRSVAISQILEIEEVAYVITEINNDLNKSSGYLGAISDRSKELYFNNQTIGQYLYAQLSQNPHTRLKNQVFYRQDYLDEFEKIWQLQAGFYPELTDNLKTEIRDIIIFYQRKLKSQKSLISFCEFESKEIELDKGGHKTKKRIGMRVAPKSSPLFQEFKIWQVLSNVEIKNKEENIKRELELNEKQMLFDELNIKGNLKPRKILELVADKPKAWEINNYSDLEGNRTNKALYEAYLKILEMEGYDVKELLKVKSNKDEVELDDINAPSTEIKDMVLRVFEALEINTEILNFNAEMDGKAFEQQASYQLWHLLYSYEGDDSPSGNEKLYELLEKKFGFKKAHAQILANVSFSDDYGSLSSKAMRKIYPYISENKYSEACELAGYKHSAASLTKEEIEIRPLKERLELLKKNSLRNPVVEKILNQMVNVVNALVDQENDKLEAEGKSRDFHFDEIRIELARELKKNAKERAEMTASINTAKIAHEKIVNLLKTEFGIKNPTRNDITRYRLYDELKSNGYKDLYTNTYIPREIVFSKQIDIEHIIPQSKLFDDSFSNKTLSFRKDNLDKGNQTAFDYINGKFGGEKLSEYVNRIEKLFELGKKSKDEGISKAKYLKLLKSESEIGDGFIDRDLRDSQYIAKKARHMLYEICRVVTPTTGSITDRLRDDWGLVNVMKELNLPKFRELGLTEMKEKKDGSLKEQIVDWTKRNDHRHHAMDALTIAFTKPSYIQYLNYLNARKNEKHKMHSNIIAIETKETELVTDDTGNKKRVFKSPLFNFRAQAKIHLESVLVSHKAKNKVVTKNMNRIKSSKGQKTKVELTPRGQLHKETVYGKYHYYETKEEKVGAKFDMNTVNMVSNPLYRELLLNRLNEHGNDPKKAFTGKNTLAKNPIYLNESKTEILPEKVKLVWLEEDYSVRKEIVGFNPTPKQFVPDKKSIEKILDAGIKRIIAARLDEFGGDPKKAFSDLDKKPIWLNKEKGISIKRVTISGVKNAEPLHYKKDHLGNDLLDSSGKLIPVDFVSTGNNHHAAIYIDADGNLQERVVSFFDAVRLVNTGLPIIDKEYNKGIGWQFLFSMKQNEYFVFPNDKTDFNPQEVDLLDPKNNKQISPNLFRVQTISIVQYGNNTIRDFKFRHHLETSVQDNKLLQGITYQQIKSLTPLENIVKVRINHIGDIVKIGED
ncbi:MAG: type II CRISPR RNA-guided endonuclease Cas9 [Bacteroidetes bacterium]|nr:type II CRISPR RNA-guided endonuclease Cas9 [Bacteroidota bacterium]